MSERTFLLAIDLGGTKLACALVAITGEIVIRRSEPTARESPEMCIRQMVRILGEVLEGSGLASGRVIAAGVGVPGVVEPESDRVQWAPNLPGWQGVDLRGALEWQLGLPVFVEYDGHTAVLGEWWVGEGRGYRSVASVIIGTGVGGGLILDGRLIRGRNRLAGAAGWFALTAEAEREDPLAAASGHWESLVSGPAIARRAGELLGDYPGSALQAVAPLTAQAVFAQARRNDPLARRVVDETAGMIGIGVANVVSLVNPEVVVLGGGVGSQGDVLLPRVRAVVRRWAQPISAASAKITCSRLGAEAGLLGAAYAALERSGGFSSARPAVSGDITNPSS